jgi:hypothetical protein
MLKRLLPWGLLLPALLGFVSVSYQACNRTDYLRADCSKPGLPRRKESGTDFFGLALHPRRSRVLECHCHPHLEVCAKRQKRVTIAPSGRLTR